MKELKEYPDGTKPHLMIIDSFALLFRGFYALALTGNYMRTSQGLYTNGMYQFTRYMLDAIKKFGPTHVVCAFDMGKSTFRNELYPEYKAQRGEPPVELIPQFDKLWELVDAFDIPCVGTVGYEADDMIGSLAKSYSAQGVQVSILTGDGDSLQLIDENTQVILFKKGFGNYEVVTTENLYELKGVQHPYQIIEMKGLMGDTSDNIPGCPSVGPKTALKLIAEFDSIEQLFASIDQVKGKLKERLLENKDLIMLSRDLATIRTDVPFECTLDRCAYGTWDQAKLIAKLEEFEFRSFVRTFSASAG
ncbi:5'-3' exonuclease [Paenibacillus sp. y28]|uniref:5'-3' exonuclease n=1 Tax=Paenibacillus sp. y28 TaxID=3129110 RepID=UPI0030187355